MFSSASLFSKPISQAIPRGKPGDGSSESLTIGIRACGRGFTWNLVSVILGQVHEAEERIYDAYHAREGHLA